MTKLTKINIREKIGYALGDGAANIAWRGVATYLIVFYTDVFGLAPAAVGLLMLIARSGDGLSDILMGIVGDRTKSKFGKFRPWILWTAIPLGIMLSLLFTAPNLSPNGKLAYAYITYIIFTLVYTANNIPYGALMAVMTVDDKERTSIGSYRMVGAFAGGMLVQGALLYLVAHFGNVNPSITVAPLNESQCIVTLSTDKDVENAGLSTKDGLTYFYQYNKEDAQKQISFSMIAEEAYQFFSTSEEIKLQKSDIQLIDQSKGYSQSMYALSIILAICLLITFFSTKERIVSAPKEESNLKSDFHDLIRNKPWIILLCIGLLFNIYNSIKQGITVIYFTHYLHNQLLAASFMVGLTMASIFGAMITTPLARRWGKRNLFVYALLFSAAVNALLIFCAAEDITAIFAIGIISEFAAAIFPTLFFAMLGDVADYSEWKNGRRATGLIYSAGSFATKFGGGIAGAIIGLVLSAFAYNGQNPASIEGAIPGIKMLMSWIPSIVAVIGAFIMSLYPLNQEKMNIITHDLKERR